MKKEGARLSIGILPESFSKNPGHSSTGIPTHPERQHFLDGVFTAPFRDRHDDLVDVVLLDDPIHLRGVAEDFPDLLPGGTVLRRRGIDETDEMKTEAFLLLTSSPTCRATSPVPTIRIFSRGASRVM